MSQAGYSSYLVGGCVRDILLGKTPKDWDLASDATPDQVLKVFEHAHYDNEYGTVRIVNDDTNDPKLKVVEITTFRKDIGYSDDRRPDAIEYSTDIADDLSRRDFTINALAYPLTSKTIVKDTAVFKESHVVDLHEGLSDLKNKVIKTVGNPDDRFGEDALRLLRAVRFAAQLDFAIESQTLVSLTANANRLQNIAVERIADEFNKLIMTDNPGFGLELLRRTNLLQQFIPELLEGVGIEQNQAHSFTVWEHLVRTLQASADKGFDLDIRLAALFHDIAKPATREISRESGQPTFYNHEIVGAKTTKAVLKRLKYPKSVVSRVTMFVRWHMFFSDPDEVTLSAVRRLIANVGAENIWDLVNLRICDRVGTGRPKEEPYRLRKFQAMIEEAERSPTSVKMLAIDGNTLINTLHMKPGRIIGDILHILLAKVLEDPELNNPDSLLQISKDLISRETAELSHIANQARAEVSEVESAKIKAIRDKYYVK